MEIIFETLWKILCDAAKEVLVFAEAYGGDVRELVVFVDEARVRVWCVAAAREDIKDGDGVARSEPD